MKKCLVAGVTLIALPLLIFSFWKLGRSRTFQCFGGLLARVETDRKVVALTFDDGPTPEYTSGVLKTLDGLGVKATFYVTGREMEAFSQEGRRIVAAGHELGNHTYSHRRMVFKSYRTIRHEIEQTDRLIRLAGYQGPITFRPPYCKKLFLLPLYLRRTGRTTITLDLEPDSDPRAAADSDFIVRSAVDGSRSGSIILLHVMYKGRETSRRAIRGIVAGLRAKGYDFVTVSELLALKD